MGQWWVRLEKVGKEGSGHTEHLDWQYWLMILHTLL